MSTVPEILGMIDTRVNMMRNFTFIPNMGRSQKWSSFEMSSSSSLFTLFRWFNFWGNARTLLVWSCTETPAEVRRHFLQSRFVDDSFSFLLFLPARVCVLAFVRFRSNDKVSKTSLCFCLSEVFSVPLRHPCLQIPLPGAEHTHQSTSLKMSTSIFDIVDVIECTWFAPHIFEIEQQSSIFDIGDQLHLVCRSTEDQS